MSTLRRDVGTAYLSAGLRLVAWMAVTAIVYRRLGAPAFALLALVRTTIGLLNYTMLGLAPATVRMLAVESADPGTVYSSAVALGVLSAVGAAILAVAYAVFFGVIHLVPVGLGATHVTGFVLSMGLAAVARLSSEPFGAALQVRGKISLDNLIIGGAETLWLGMCLMWIGADSLNPVGYAALICAIALAVVRILCANRAMGRHALGMNFVGGAMIRRLLAFGLFVALAQAADFLYAPTDNILINRFINPIAVATYAPAIQIDAGLLLLVAGFAAVLLPHSALAHGAGEIDKVRRYYIHGTLLSIALLLPAAAAIWAMAPWLLRRWLGDAMPATQVILPLVLIHTVVGGSSAVGRSILLGIGRVRPFTAAVLIAGAGNVALSFVFVRYAGWGLKGIVLGTIIAVVARCAFWTPWYVTRSLRQAEAGLR